MESIRHKLGLALLVRRDLPIILLSFIVQRIFRYNASSPALTHFTSTVIDGRKLVIGRNVHLSLRRSGGCYLQAIHGIAIGDDTVFAPGVKIISANHDVLQLGQPEASRGGVSIGMRCWIGANAVILPGVTIEDEAIVAAGAVVTSDVPSGVTVAGVPARVLHSVTRSTQ